MDQAEGSVNPVGAEQIKIHSHVLVVKSRGLEKVKIGKLLKLCQKVTNLQRSRPSLFKNIL